MAFPDIFSCTSAWRILSVSSPLMLFHTASPACVGGTRASFFVVEGDVAGPGLYPCVIMGPLVLLHLRVAVFLAVKRNIGLVGVLTASAGIVLCS